MESGYETGGNGAGGALPSETQVKQIKTISRRKGLTVSEIIRRMIDGGLERMRERKPVMKCKTCQKKITFEHFYGSTGGGSKAGKILLVLKVPVRCLHHPLRPGPGQQGEGPGLFGKGDASKD